MKTKNNYKFPVGGVVSIASAVVIYIMSTYFTGRTVFNYIRSGLNVTTFVNVLVQYSTYISLSLALMMLGALLLFKMRNPWLVVSPVTGISAYVGISLFSFLALIKQFNLELALMRIERFFDLLIDFLDGGAFYRLLNFYSGHFHYTYVTPVGNMIGYFIITFAFIVFVAAILACTIGKKGKKNEKKGILAIISAVIAALGFGSVLATSISTWALNVLYYICREYSFRVIIDYSWKFMISSSVVLPLTCLVCVVVSFVLAGMWIAKPYKKAKAVEPPVAE